MPLVRERSITPAAETKRVLVLDSTLRFTASYCLDADSAFCIGVETAQERFVAF
jgi:hypothetical protein